MALKTTVDYVLNMISKGKRPDGRAFDAFRDIKIETGVSKNAEGSARVRLGQTEVIAGIKMDIGEPYPDASDEGVLKTTAEFLAMAALEFELGPPSAEAIELARVVDRGIRHANVLDTKALCITPGEKVWTVYVDILIINHDGNLIDAAGIAAMAALLDAKMPKLNEDGTINYEEHVSPLIIKEIPIPITTRKGQNALLVDTTALEEEAISARLTVTTRSNGNICSIQQGSGLFTVDEIVSITEKAQKIAKEIREKHFGKALKSLKIK